MLRNIAILVQEFEIAGRNSESSDGKIFVKESIDHRRLIYWTKDCLKNEIVNYKKKNTNARSGYRVFRLARVTENVC